MNTEVLLSIAVGIALVLSVLAVVVPFVAVAIVLVVLIFAVRLLYKKFIQPT